MRIFVKAKPGAREENIEKLDDNHFIVAVKEPPVQGRANAAIIRALADYFGLATSRLEIVSGRTAREKIVEIK